MDKNTMKEICEFIKVITPLIIILLSVCGFSHVNTQMDTMNSDIDNVHEDVHNVEKLHLKSMSDEEIDDYKGHLDEDEAKDLENRLRVYLND